MFFLALYLFICSTAFLLQLLLKMLSTWLGIRARILRHGITNMLTDLGENSTNNLGSKFKSFFLQETQRVLNNPKLTYFMSNLL